MEADAAGHGRSSAQDRNAAGRDLIQSLPKCELHVHIEVGGTGENLVHWSAVPRGRITIAADRFAVGLQGCIPPAMMFEMAIRNGLQDKLPFATEAEAQAAFQYENLQQFLDLRDASLQVGCQVSR